LGKGELILDAVSVRLIVAPDIKDLLLKIIVINLFHIHK
jgi:hypothetical protein